MAARNNTPEKRPGFFSQLRTLYTFTAKSYRWLPWLLIGILILGIAAGVGLGFAISGGSVWGIILWGVTGLMAGILAAMVTMTRLSTRAMYRQMDGMPGAVGHILSTSLGRNWRSDNMPVGINPKTQEAVYRAIGRGGVVIVGEGSRGRLTRLMKEERGRIKRVATGVDVTELYVGDGDDDVALDRLARTIKKLPKNIDRATMAAVIKRVDSVSQSVTSLPIPKGIDPTKVRAQRPR